MKTRYILGRARTGKTHLIFEEIEEKLKKESSKKLVLLVPEQFTLQTEEDLIFKSKLDGIMNVEVLSFERIAYKIFSEVGGLKKTTLNELGKIMVLRKLFDDYSKDLTVYKKGSSHEGFLTNFCSLISEFKRNDVSVESLKARIEEISEDNMLKRKLKDIVLIYEKFNEFILGKYTDEDDKFNVLLDKLDKSSYFQNTEIWVDGFHSFSSQEYKILEKIMLKAEQTSISLTLDNNLGAKDKELFNTTRDTYKNLCKIAEKNSINQIITETPLKAINLKPHIELEHLEKNIYAYPYKVYGDNVEAIEVFSGTNQYTEIENVAAQIISLVRDKGYRWRDIALVSNSKDVYSPIIKRVFSEYGIPYFLDEKRNILNNPIIKLLMSSIEILSRNFKYEDVFKFIKTGFSDLSKNEYEALENYVLKHGIEGDRWLEDFVFENHNLDRINEGRKKFVEPFVRLKGKIKTNNKVLDLTRNIFEFITDLRVEEKLSKWIEIHRHKGNLEYVNENTQIWNIIMEVFDQLVEILGDTKVTLKEYGKILQAGFGAYKVGIIPPSIDQVLIGSLERSKSHDIKALFVVGVNDGILPSAFEDGGILLDDEKIVIKGMGIQLNSDNETKSNEEQLSIYSSLVKPKEYLWISYALADSEGKALRPSILIDRIKKLYKNIKVNSDISNDAERQLNLISKPLSTFKYLIENIRLDIDEKTIDSLWWEVYHWYYSHDEWRERLGYVIEGFFHKNQKDYISEKDSRSIYEFPFKSSISRLESFVNCPFAHFINYGLKPEERKVHKINAPDLGMLYHKSVEEFSKELTLNKLNWHDLQRDKADEIVEKVLDKMVEEFQYGIFLKTHRYKYLINKLKRISKRALWTITDHIRNGEFLPMEHEIHFGEAENSHIPPIIIALPNGEEIKLEGRIDRVDILKGENGSYVKVIDYKSGSKKFSLSDVYYGLQIQLVVYLDAIISNKDRLKETELHPGGIFYFKIDDPMIKSEDDDIEIIEAEIAKQLKLDGVIVKDIKLVKSMDKLITEGSSSSIIPVSLKKDGDFSKASSVLEKEDLEDLIKHVKGLVSEIGSEIIKGKIRIEPCKIGNQVSCEYCQFEAVCQFDTSFEDNRYKAIKKLKDDEVLEKIKGKKEGEE